MFCKSVMPIDIKYRADDKKIKGVCVRTNSFYYGKLTNTAG